MNNYKTGYLETYTFLPYFDGSFHSGKFHSKEGKQLTPKVYNGCVCIQVKNKRYGMKKLRGFAKRSLIKHETLPF